MCCRAKDEEKDVRKAIRERNEHGRVTEALQEECKHWVWLAVNYSILRLIAKMIMKHSTGPSSVEWPPTPLHYSDMQIYSIAHASVPFGGSVTP